MKRTTTLLILALALTSFTNKEIPPVKKGKKMRPATALLAPTNEMIVIDKDKFEKTTTWDEFALWETANSQYYSTTATITDPQCHNRVVVDLTKVGDTDVKVAKWLKANTDYICFDDSYAFIENVHKVTDAAMIQNIDKAIKDDEATSQNFEDFIKEINYYDDFNYEMYLNFVVDPSKKISFKPVSKYVVGMRSFSLPSIKSIVKVNKITKDEFYKYTINFVEVPEGTGKAIAFRIDRGTTMLYYDYSTNPGTPPTRPGTVISPTTRTSPGNRPGSVMLSKSIF